jgi:hypothetical protein
MARANRDRDGGIKQLILSAVLSMGQAPPTSPPNSPAIGRIFLNAWRLVIIPAYARRQKPQDSSKIKRHYSRCNQDGDAQRWKKNRKSSPLGRIAWVAPLSVYST